MTIEVHTGFVGSGKSYAATKLGINIADAKFGKRYVIANFPISDKSTMFAKYRKKKKTVPTRWIYKDNQSLTVDYLVKKSIEMKWNEKEGSCLVIFDEASIPFNTRSWNSADRLDWIKFLTQSRKFGYDFIFITQDSRMIDKQIKSLCEYEVQYKKLNNTFGFAWLSLFRITLFAAVKYWNGMKYTKGQLRIYKYSKRVANRYDTLNLFGYGGDGDEQSKNESDTD